MVAEALYILSNLFNVLLFILSLILISGTISTFIVFNDICLSVLLHNVC